MTTPTLYVADRCRQGQTIVLSGKERHYLVRVLRTRPGDSVRLCDRGGCVATATVLEVDEHSVSLAVVNVSRSDTPDFRLTLVASGLKKKGTEQLVARCAELGVDHLVLTNMRRSVAKVSGQKLPRMEAVAAESARKVAQPRVVSLAAGDSLPDVLGRLAGRPLFFLWEKGGASAGTLELTDLAEAVCVIGPEGGFDDSEVELMLESGATPLHFKGPAYTAPTAAVMGITLFMLKAGRL